MILGGGGGIPPFPGFCMKPCSIKLVVSSLGMRPLHTPHTLWGIHCFHGNWHSQAPPKPLIIVPIFLDQQINRWIDR